MRALRCLARVAFVLVWALSSVACTTSPKDEPAGLGPKLAAQSAESDFLMPFYFTTEIDHERLAPGLTPNADKMRGVVSRYVLLAQDFIFYPAAWQTRLHGFRFEAAAEPRPAREVELGLYAGLPSLFPNSLMGIEPPPLGTPLAPLQGLRLLVKSRQTLPPTSQKPWPIWRFDAPLGATLAPGEALLLRVRYLEAEPKPGQGGFGAGQVALLIPNVQHAQSLPSRLQSRANEPNESACDANPEGAMVCFYPMGYAEYYTPKDPKTPAAYGRYLRHGSALTLSLAGYEPIRAEVLAADRPHALGPLGQGFVRKVLAMNDERCRPYAPAWRQLAPLGLGPKDVLTAYEAGFGLNGQEGLALRTKNGRLLALARSFEKEPLALTLNVAVGSEAEVLTIWSPTEGRALLAVHEAPTDVYKVYSYEYGRHAWTLVLHREMPWRPWLPEGEIKRALRPDELPGTRVPQP